MNQKFIYCVKMAFVIIIIFLMSNFTLNGTQQFKKTSYTSHPIHHTSSYPIYISTKNKPQFTKSHRETPLSRDSFENPYIRRNPSNLHISPHRPKSIIETPTFDLPRIARTHIRKEWHSLTEQGVFSNHRRLSRRDASQ